MPVSRAMGESIGKLFANLRDHKFYAAEIGKQTMSIVVLGPAAKKTVAYCKAHLFGPDRDESGRAIQRHHIADVYRCDDGHEYIHQNGESYRYDTRTDSWTTA